MKKNPVFQTLPETEAYWQATKEGILLIKTCHSCKKHHFYPRDICPHCLSTDTGWLESTGYGSVYSFSTMGKDDDAYTLAFITLDEGVTMLSNLVDCDPAQVKLGDRVRVVFVPSVNGHAVPMFTPV